MALYYKSTGSYFFPTSRYVDTSKNRKSKPVPRLIQATLIRFFSQISTFYWYRKRTCKP